LMLHMALGLGVAVIATGWYWGDLRGFYTGALQAASVFFFDSSTPDMLHTAYAAAKAGGKPVSILIVPGHDAAASGTSYHGLSEADMTLATGQELERLFKADPLVSALSARETGWYIPELSDFFAQNRARILGYRAQETGIMERLMALGKVHSDIVVDHNTAPDEVALRLYGINLWANEHSVDAVLHIHYNDIPRHNRALAGPYTGFAIYIPEHQYSNYKGSLALAQAIKARLLEHEGASTLPGERGGIIEDQGLIAIGSHNSVDAAAVLVECAYVYEPQLQDPGSRQKAIEQCAQSIYGGVEDFFASTTVIK
jgi:N-acetylmuramoyl-L-alanine amidase